MSVIFAVIGVVVGIIAAVSNDFSIGFGALVGGVAGVAIARLLQKKRPGVANEPTSKPAAAYSLSQPGSPSGTLAERVEQLEREIVALRGEIHELRASVTGVSATESVDGDPATFKLRPANVVPRPYAMPPAVRQKSHPEPEAMPAQPAAVRPTASATAVTPPVSAGTPASSASGASSTLSAQPTSPMTLSPSAGPALSTEQLPAQTPPAPPSPPRGPNLAERLFKSGRDWLFGGNTVVRVGIIVLFFGIAFLLKYAADNSLLPIEFRLAGVALAATVLIGLGWRIGERRGAYGLILQGGGVGALYLTVFAATRLYHLLPAGAALPLMIAICGLSAFLAVRQNASSLAFMGSAGGFLAPVLLSTGGGSHVMLFSYYALLNAGIFAIAWFKAWRPLNLLGFVFTFSIGAAWGVTAYRPELLASTEPFLILFFLMYVGIALLYAVRREVALKHYVDGTLVFGTPLVAIGLQAALMKGTEFGLAWSAVALAAFYLAIAGWLARRRAHLGMMFEAMLALAVIFATLAVPLAFTGPTTSATWAIEGAAITWLAVRQRRLIAFGFGLLMQLAAAGAYVVGTLAQIDAAHAWPVLNGAYIASVLIAVAGIFTGWRLHGRSEAGAWHAWMPQIGLVAGVWGLSWWILGGLSEINTYAQTHLAYDRDRFETAVVALFAVLTAWLAHGTRRKLRWPLVELPALALVPVLALLTLGLFMLSMAPVSGYGWLVCAVAAASTYLLLWRQQRDVGDRVLAPLHTLMFWTAGALVALEGYWGLRAYVPEGAWSWSAWAYGFGILLLLVAGVGHRLRWPVARFVMAYQVWAAAPLAALLWAWSIASVTSDGSAAPLFWLPILNPLDVAQILAFIACAVWLRRLRALGVHWHPRAFDYAVLATLFLWFNALLLRTLHHHFHAAYDVDAVLASFNFQQVFLVGWSAFAFAGLWLARRDSIVRLCAIASTPLVLVMWVWTFYANLTQDGGAWAQLPLLNPLDLVQAVIFALAALWLVRISRLGVPVGEYRVPLQVAVGVTGFIWLNAMLLRTLHHWIGVPYQLDEMSHSMLVQASVSVFWTVCALAMMIWATRRASRIFWFIGGGLLAATVVKLFLFDLSHVTGIERIVSFIGIGLMLLLIGYFSPLPPKAAVLESEQ
ncbi:UNVERIFIED_ORG: putative membrane protein [Paraburkholderia sediminicola]|nr:putative membrane protein [Paraburkholderia sediminicola]